MDMKVATTLMILQMLVANLRVIRETMILYRMIQMFKAL